MKYKIIALTFLMTTLCWLKPNEENNSLITEEAVNQLLKALQDDDIESVVSIARADLNILARAAAASQPDEVVVNALYRLKKVLKQERANYIATGFSKRIQSWYNAYRLNREIQKWKRFFYRPLPIAIAVTTAGIVGYFVDQMIRSSY